MTPPSQPRKFFGTDGVRGEVGAPPMTPDFLVRLGFAAGKALGAREALIIKDTRLSGYMVESALEAGFSAAGVNVLLCGPLPTAAAAYLAQTLRLDVGVVVSASHNPHRDNGVKFFGGDGEKLPDEMESKIESILAQNRPLSFTGEPGRARRLDDAAGRYIEFCKRAFPKRLNLRGMKILADCANGAAYHVAPPVFHELGAEVIPFANEPDGFNINVNCGATAPEHAARAALQNQCDIGVILDGDADRLILADENGNLRDGDAALLVIARHMAEHSEAPEGIVGTVLSNLAFERAARNIGADFHRAPVGDRHISAAMRERNWPLGGEPSGHLILRDIHNTGDGVMAALRVLAAMRESGKTLSELLADYAPLPQAKRNVRCENSAEVLQTPAARKAIAREEKEMGGAGRVVVRPSGTEPLARVMVEGENKADIETRADRIAEAIQSAAPPSPPSPPSA